MTGGQNPTPIRGHNLTPIDIHHRRGPSRPESSQAGECGRPRLCDPESDDRLRPTRVISPRQMRILSVGLVRTRHDSCNNACAGKARSRGTRCRDVIFEPGFPFCLPRMAPLYTRGPPSARNSVHRTIVQLQRPSPQPALTCDRLEPLLSGHSSDTAPHLCPFFVRRASLHSPRVSLPGPVAPRSSAACRRTAAGSDALPPAGASSTSRASPAGLRFSPAAAASSSATSA